MRSACILLVFALTYVAGNVLSGSLQPKQNRENTEPSERCAFSQGQDGRNCGGDRKYEESNRGHDYKDRQKPQRFYISSQLSNTEDDSSRRLLRVSVPSRSGVHEANPKGKKSTQYNEEIVEPEPLRFKLMFRSLSGSSKSLDSPLSNENSQKLSKRVKRADSMSDESLDSTESQSRPNERAKRAAPISDESLDSAEGKKKSRTPRRRTKRATSMSDESLDSTESMENNKPKGKRAKRATTRSDESFDSKDSIESRQLVKKRGKRAVSKSSESSESAEDTQSEETSTQRQAVSSNEPISPKNNEDLENSELVEARRKRANSQEVASSTSKTKTTGGISKLEDATQKVGNTEDFIESIKRWIVNVHI